MGMTGPSDGFKEKVRQTDRLIGGALQIGALLLIILAAVREYQDTYSWLEWCGSLLIAALFALNSGWRRSLKRTLLALVLVLLVLILFLPVPVGSFADQPLLIVYVFLLCSLLYFAYTIS